MQQETNMADLMARLADVAAEISDGHFTVMKFTTNWYVGFYTPDGRGDTLGMAEGETFVEAAQKALTNPERYTAKAAKQAATRAREERASHFGKALASVARRHLRGR
jgi:hypothetical protein